MTSKLTLEGLRDQLAALNLDIHGNKDQLQKRLRKARVRIRHQLQEGEDQAQERRKKLWKPKYRNFLVLDVEATCEQTAKTDGFQYPNESACFERYVRKKKTIPK